MSEQWYEDQKNVLELISFLAYSKDWTAKEIVDVVEKPYKFEDEYKQYLEYENE